MELKLIWDLFPGASQVPQGLWLGQHLCSWKNRCSVHLVSQNPSGGALGVPRMKCAMKCSSTTGQRLSKGHLHRVGQGWIVLCDPSDPRCPFAGH